MDILIVGWEHIIRRIDIVMQCYTLTCLCHSPARAIISIEKVAPIVIYDLHLYYAAHS